MEIRIVNYLIAVRSEIETVRVIISGLRWDINLIGMGVPIMRHKNKRKDGQEECNIYWQILISFLIKTQLSMIVLCLNA